MRLKRGLSGLNGVLLADKPLGMTSHDVVDRLRALTGEKRIGHAGTLDPDASGLLVTMIGRATKYSDELTASEKMYRATIVFGTATDTDDAQGAVISHGPLSPELLDEEFARTTVKNLIGAHKQIPPAYSAVKVDGKRSYKAARSGEVPTHAARDVVVLDATLVDIVTDDYAWVVELTVSKGTYIRSLARDLGESLGTRAHIGALRRLACGELNVDDALSLAYLEEHVTRPFEIARYFIEYRQSAPAPCDAEVVIGVFDGLHRGHRALIDACVKAARERGVESVMVTFDRLPEPVLGIDRELIQLYPSQTRLRRARECGIDRVITIPFTPEFSRLSPDEFISRELLTRVIPHRIWIGADFRFGAGSQADGAALAKLGATYGFEVRIIDLIEDNGSKIGSTAVRDALASGDVERAASLLGEPYALCGTVEQSRGIGRRHGFPTANITSSRSLRGIGDGVYRGTVILTDASMHPAAIFVGVPSNATDDRRVLEAHLLDFDEDLAGQEIVVTFEQRLRDVTKVEDEAHLFEIVDDIVSNLT